MDSLCGPIRYAVATPREEAPPLADKFVYDFEEGNGEMKDLLAGRGRISPR
jgi:hypothetical protein